MIKYNCAVDNAALVKKLELKRNGLIKDLKDFIPTGFLGKCVIKIEMVEKLADSSVFLTEGYLLDQKVLNVNEKSELVVNIEGFDGNGDNAALSFDEKDGHCIHILSNIDTPLIAKSGVPDDKALLLERAKIFNLNIIICNDGLNAAAPTLNKKFLESYGEMGFVMIDIGSFNAFLEKQQRVISNNLIEEFTTTELANDLFDEGLMVLCWGMTPWVYYISSINSDSHFLASLGVKTMYQGIYKLREEIKLLSVIPGNMLTDWKTCTEKEWPRLELDGKGDFVKLELFINSALSQSDADYPIPTFNISRTNNGCSSTEPLLESNVF